MCNRALYPFNEIKRVFGEDCFRMSIERGAVIFYKKEEDGMNWHWLCDEDGFFRQGDYTFYMHDQTEKYVIGSFATI